MKKYYRLSWNILFKKYIDALDIMENVHWRKKNYILSRKSGQSVFQTVRPSRESIKTISTLIKVTMKILFFLILYLGHLLLLVVLKMIFKSIWRNIMEYFETFHQNSVLMLKILLKMFIKGKKLHFITERWAVSLSNCPSV